MGILQSTFFKGPSGNGLNIGLVSYYKADVNGSYSDEMGVNNGTINGATYTASGKINGAYDFNGTNNNIDLGTNASLNFTSNFSINVWVYNRNSGNEKAIVTRYKYDTNQRQFYILKAAANTFNFTLGLSSGASSQTISTAYTLNTWTMLTAVYDDINNLMLLYKDGTLANSSAYSSALTGFTQNVGIGQLMNTPVGANFDGVIDEVGFWGRALSATDVTNLYNAGSGLGFGSFTY